MDIQPGKAQVELSLLEEMSVDASGLIHGGFIFAAADYAAMLAVNEPNVVLSSAQTRFLRPSQIGDTLQFIAHIERSDGRKHAVAVQGLDAQQTVVFEGQFECVVPSRHVLEPRPRQA